MAEWPWRSRSITPIFNTSHAYPRMHLWCKFGSTLNLWWVIVPTSRIASNSESKWPKWPWRSRSMTALFNTSWEYSLMHFWCKFGDPSSNLWQVTVQFTDRQMDGKTHAKIKIRKCCLQDVPAPQIYSCSTVHISAVWVTSAGSPVDIRVSVSRSVPSLVRGAAAAGLGRSSTEVVPDELVLLWRRQTGFGKIENLWVSGKKTVQIFNRDMCFVFFIQFTQNMSHLSAVNDKQVWVNQVKPSDVILPHRSGLTSTQVMACCLMAPSHYLNQWWPSLQPLPERF